MLTVGSKTSREGDLVIAIDFTGDPTTELAAVAPTRHCDFKPKRRRRTFSARVLCGMSFISIPPAVVGRVRVCGRKYRNGNRVAKETHTREATAVALLPVYPFRLRSRARPPSAYDIYKYHGTAAARPPVRRSVPSEPSASSHVILCARVVCAFFPDRRSCVPVGRENNDKRRRRRFRSLPRRDDERRHERERVPRLGRRPAPEDIQLRGDGEMLGRLLRHR